jgi:hypothetical protein
MQRKEKEQGRMIELNAEQIKKALERNIRVSMALAYDCPRITYSKLREALALINSQEQKIKELTEENERLKEHLDEHFPKCIYQYDGEVQEYCVLSPCGQFKTVAEFQKQIEANTVRKMSALLNAQIDEITRSRIELRAFPFAALLAERMKVIVAETAKKVEEGSV